MPKPVGSGQRYMPGLDGLRAIAVLAVIAFHEQLGWAPGGLLGVGVFFTLSGYLITDLLLGQWAARGRLAHLIDRRARRRSRPLSAQEPCNRSPDGATDRSCCVRRATLRYRSRLDELCPAHRTARSAAGG